MTAFCILAAGKGDRLRGVTKLHKALLPINNRAVISHIIDKAPADAEIIIAIGHQKDTVREYCLAAHPEREFTFVEVANYNGPGSGPGLSLSCCKNYLQRPFYLVCADCIVKEPLPSLENNWIGVQPVADPSNWSTALVRDGVVTDFMNKSPGGYGHAFIGLAGIRDYGTFWSQMGPGGDKEYEMVSAFYSPRSYRHLLAVNFTWHDTGTPENYSKSKDDLGTSGLGMSKEIDELTYRVGRRCVKIFGSPEVAEGRIYRAQVLDGLTPAMLYAGKHSYAYEWIDGRTLYEVNDPQIFANFLDWCQRYLWVGARDGNFQRSCSQFYRDKTHIRLGIYCGKKSYRDRPQVINGRPCADIDHYMACVDWVKLSQGVPVTFHGDLQFENVIYSDDGKFFLIDWRDSFGEVVSYGDLYYDFAKLYGGLSMSYHNIKLGRFIFNRGRDVNYSFETTPELAEMKYYFENWLLKNGYDLYKVRLLSALIYLNMAPLHTAPFDELLFNHSKYMLSVTI